MIKTLIAAVREPPFYEILPERRIVEPPFFLNRQQGKARDQGVEGARRDGLQAHDRRIVLIDDEPRNLTLLTRALETAGFTSIWSNIRGMENKGWEFSTTANWYESPSTRGLRFSTTREESIDGKPSAVVSSRAPDGMLLRDSGAIVSPLATAERNPPLVSQV